MSEMTLAMLTWGLIITVMTVIKVWLQKKAEQETEALGPQPSREEQARIEQARDEELIRTLRNRGA